MKSIDEKNNAGLMSKEDYEELRRLMREQELKGRLELAEERGRKKGLEFGRIVYITRVIIMMKEDGYLIEKIIKYTSSTKEEVENILKKN